MIPAAREYGFHRHKGTRPVSVLPRGPQWAPNSHIPPRGLEYWGGKGETNLAKKSGYLRFRTFVWALLENHRSGAKRPHRGGPMWGCLDIQALLPVLLHFAFLPLFRVLTRYYKAGAWGNLPPGVVLEEAGAVSLGGQNWPYPAYLPTLILCVPGA